MDANQVKIIVTLGPSTRREEDLRALKQAGVDFVRVNMSHSSLDDLRYFLKLAKKIGLPFIIDTEGSQIRCGEIADGRADIKTGDIVNIHKAEIGGDSKNISLRPGLILEQLEPGDLIHIDFDSLILRVSDVSTLAKGYISTQAIVRGSIQGNKAVVVDAVMPKKFKLPPLSAKDYESIRLGLAEGVGYIAASFMRSGAFVDTVREACQNRMQVISKMECVEALENLDEIIEKSDMLLIDRGDLSKEIPIEKIPFAQKIILAKARAKNKEVIVATNLLETMVTSARPTRAEVHDVVATVLDGAGGVALSAETAIGKYPLECVTMMQKLLKQTKLVPRLELFKNAQNILALHLESKNYLLDEHATSILVQPHGGVLINRILGYQPEKSFLEQLPKIELSDELQMDVEQIATGVFSPLEGFMGSEDLICVLDSMRLTSGAIWTLPMLLDVSEDRARDLREGQDILLTGEEGEPRAVLHLTEKYIYDKKKLAQKLYGTLDENHPGVRRVLAMRPVFLAGKIDLLQRRKAEFGDYALTPRQVRRIFSERHWSRVVGFHTRNVIHRSHEFIQLEAMRKENCDGLFVHPIVGKKKPGDYHAPYIVKSYERMMNGIYPKDRVMFATFNTYSRYAGPREAIFTAICRQNFGCSHFVVGRDHTGVGNFYPPDASHKIFDKFPDLAVKPIKFGEVFFSPKLGSHVHAAESPDHDPADKLSISGTQARKIFEKGETPPEWFMRPEISDIILTAAQNGEEVFVRK